MATEFSALVNVGSISRGLGANNFNKVDVSEYDDYVTLSGVRKGQNPSAISQAKDLSRLYDLYWNAKQVQVKTSISGSSTEFTNETMAYKRLDSSGNYDASGSTEPKDRVERASMAFIQDIATSINTNFIRIYNGSTSSESNFFGYAANGSFTGATVGTSNSYLFGTEASGILTTRNALIGVLRDELPDDTDNLKMRKEYAEIEGDIHFIGFGLSFSSLSGPGAQPVNEPNLSFTNGTAKVTSVIPGSPTETVVVEFGNGTNVVEFHTYS